MIKNKLAHAVALVLASGSLASTASASSTTSFTMYNQFQTASASATDGWVWGGVGVGTPKPASVVPSPTTNPGISAQANPGFVGTADSNNDGNGDTPFTYIGSSHLNWAAQLTDAGDSLQISQADSVERYSFAAEIDTGAGAWMDAGDAEAGKAPTGWKHQTDIGLISVAEDMLISIAATAVGGNALDNFGMTVFEGMDTNTGNYSHHGGWNTNGTASTNDNPFGTTGVSYIKHDGTVDSSNLFTFNAEAGKVYSLYLGGAGVGTWNNNVENYQLDITTSAVPVPAAAWLMGSAILGLVGMRRKAKAV